MYIFRAGLGLVRDKTEKGTEKLNNQDNVLMQYLKKNQCKKTHNEQNVKILTDSTGLGLERGK